MRIYSIIILVFCAATATGADKKGNYAIWGVGNKSCHSYNLARAANEDNKYKDYIMGYFTAYNHEAVDTYSISRDMNMDDILTWLDEQCEMKPVVSFEEILTTFILDNYENRMKSSPNSRVGR
jgi:hypothetical protein